MKLSRKKDAPILLLLLLLPLLWFGPQTLGGKTLLPAENLYTFEPWAGAAASFGVGVPQNPLVSDLVLENYQWKSLLRDAVRDGQIPLWNSRLFAGVPFLAAGQHSALYPLSILFYVLPLWLAYGIFTWLQLGLAAAGTYVFARVLGQRRPAAFLAAVAFSFSGFFISSVNFTMIIAAAAWLPLILTMIELVVRTVENVRENGGIEEHGQSAAVPARRRRGPAGPIPYVALGAVLFGLQALAGHVEITYYVLMVSAFYAAWRLGGAWLRLRSDALPPKERWARTLQAAAWLLVMAVLGMGLGGVQLVPMYELATQNFRQGSANLQQVINWAWPKKQIITFVLPDFFGNPTNHSYFDIWRQSWVPVTLNSLGQPLKDITNGAIDWGAKNYVEGANYLGLLTLLLALVATLSAAQATWARLRRNKALPASPAAASQPARLPLGPTTGFVVLAVLSLLFAFGTPVYAVLFYLAPGYNQLHSAFRWVFPYTLSMALLAGFGLDVLLRGDLSPRLRRAVRVLGTLTVAAGLGSLAAVALSLVLPGPFVAFGNRLLAASELARTRGFADGAMAWSYEAFGLARFGALAALSGAVLLWGIMTSRGTRSESRTQDSLEQEPPSVTLAEAVHKTGETVESNASASPQVRQSKLPLWSVAAIGVLILDLWLFGHAFNPASDPRLLSYKPPVIGWLQGMIDNSQPWRFTTYDAPNQKLLNANAAMSYGLEDIRGYDSMIPRQYVAYMQRIQNQGELLYNRIAPFYGPGSGQWSDALDNRLLNLLGVRYVMTTQDVVNQGYRLAYPADHQPAQGEVRVYENTKAMPRVFIVSQAQAAADQTAALDALQKVDPAHTVVLEGLSADAVPAPSAPQVHEARISQRGLREVMVDVNVSDRGWLVFTENFFPGWKAYIRPFGAQGEGVSASGDSVEKQMTLYRADGTFRAVYLDRAGQWTIRFVYSPQSLLLGIYLSFLCAITLALVAGVWAWNRYYRGMGSEVGTAAKNTAVLVVMQLVNRGIDFAFTMLRLRILGPEGEGSYVNAINFYMVFDILIRWGLGTLLTRDVARDRSQGRRYLVNVLGLRALLWLASLPIIFLAALAYRAGGKLSGPEGQAIAIFAAALFFANIADAISAVFNAYEEMEYPAALATATTVGKVALGALILLPPLSLGFVGLTGVSLVMNIVQVVWLYVVLEQRVLRPRQKSRSAEELKGEAVERRARRALLPLRLSRSATPLRFDWKLQREMLRESAPLMINNLLATVFWRISQFVLRGATSATALGIFSVGVKFLDGLNVIPAFSTQAIFPLMSRYAYAGGDALVKAYRLAVQLLLIVALPIAIFASFAATPLVQIAGGTAFLPDSATSLSIMIWSIPIGFVNSVTQYVLIAVNQQRFLTKAFLIGVVFTTLANLILVPRYGSLAASAILIPAELSLFIPFAWAVHRYVAPMPWLTLTGRPILGAILNVIIVWAMNRAGVPLALGLLAGFLAYVVTLLALGTFRGDDFAVLRARMPRWRLGKAQAQS